MLDTEQIKRHNQLYEQAYDLLRGEILIDGAPPSSRVGFLAKRKLNKAIALFEEVLEMNPENWPAMFGMAKALHRLGDKARAFDLMLQAHHGNPSLSGFAREAGLVAFQLGRFREGVELTQAAIGTRPGDGSLYSNLGLGQLLAGDADAAVNAFERADVLEPNHSMTPRLLAVARAVRSGTLPHPTSEADVLRAAQQIVGRERRERVSHHNWSDDA
jgi:tetratricopeptide (TPR) repeat protein